MAELAAALTALQVAIQTEIDGYSFYRRFAQQSGDPGAGAMFDRLARDELMHLELLRSTRATLEASGEWAAFEGFAPAEVQAAPVFGRGRAEQNLVEHTSDLSALRVAYLIEKDAVDFYTRAAAETGDPNGRRMFRDLAAMEQGHLRLLQGEYEFLRGQFQEAMGFAPF